LLPVRNRRIAKDLAYGLHPGCAMPSSRLNCCVLARACPGSLCLRLVPLHRAWAEHDGRPSGLRRRFF
jgi:hypothetical protein